MGSSSSSSSAAPSIERPRRTAISDAPVRRSRGSAPTRPGCSRRACRGVVNRFGRKAAIVATVAASCLVLFAATRLTSAQQVADTTFVPKIARPAYERGTGPRVLIDEAHNNFHTMGGNYRPFAKLLEADGYRVAPNTRL